MVQPLWKTVWQFLTQLKILLPYDFVITFPGIYPKELKIYNHRNACTLMFIATIHNWQNMEATKIFFRMWMNKQTVVHSEDRLLFSAIRSELLSYEKTQRKLISCISKWNNPIWKHYIWYDFNYMTLWKMQNYKKARGWWKGRN